MRTETAALTGVAAGVPFLVVPPLSDPATAPTVVGWHLMDLPNTEAGFAETLPLDGLNAWRVYLGLPMHGTRTPPGGPGVLLEAGAQDAVLNLYGPISAQAVAEVGPALADLRDRFGIADGPIGVFGGSLGAAIALQVMAEHRWPVSAAVLISPLTQLRPMVEAIAKQYGIQYPWSAPSLKVADRLDFVARADEIAAQQPAILLAVGAEDDPDAVLHPAERLQSALAVDYRDAGRVELRVIDGMAHALAEEVGAGSAPTAHAATVDRLAVGWFQRQLGR